MRETLKDRFESKVLRTAGCWEWIAAKTRAGYGKLGIGGHDGGWGFAHRISYEIFVGPISAGMEIDHKCRNTSCVNPAHLEEVTPQENKRRARAARPPQSSFRCGHPFVAGNWYTLTNGKRYCRVCQLARCRRRNVSQY